MALISREGAWQTHQWHAEMQRKLSGPSLCQCSSECPAEVRHARSMRFHWYRGKGWRHAGHQNKVVYICRKYFGRPTALRKTGPPQKKAIVAFLGKLRAVSSRGMVKNASRLPGFELLPAEVRTQNRRDVLNIKDHGQPPCQWVCGEAFPTHHLPRPVLGGGFSS